jgi:hypothetical protein
MTRVYSIFTLMLVAALAVSCDKLGGNGSDATSKDGRLQLHLPSGWHEAELPGSIGKIQAKASAEKDAYVTVISESKEDLHHNSIQEYASSILKIEANKAKLSNRTVSAPTDMKVGAYPAVQYEVRGTLGNLNIVYVKTFIETPSRWNQVVCWTIPSHLDDERGEFQSIYESFKELPAGAK